MKNEKFAAKVRRLPFVRRDELADIVEAAVMRALEAYGLGGRRSKAPHPNKRNLTVAEVASELRCSQDTVRRYIRRGRINTLKLSGGSRILVPREELQRFLDRIS